MWTPEDEAHDDFADGAAAITEFWKSRFSPGVVAFLLIAAGLHVSCILSSWRENPWVNQVSIDSTRAWAEPWRFLTYFLFETSPIQFLFSMLGVWFFGAEVERAWGIFRFFLFIAVTAIVGGLLWVTVGPLCGRGGLPVWGAAGVANGIFFASCIITGPRILLLGFMVPVTTRVMLWGKLALDFLCLMQRGRPSWAWYAELHLGGALVAYLSVKQLPKVMKMIGKWRSHAHIRMIEQESQIQAEVDRILAKVHSKGIGNLTPHERETLNRASRTTRQTP